EANRERATSANFPVDRPPHGPDRREPRVGEVAPTECVVVKIEWRDKNVDDGERHEHVPEPGAGALTSQFRKEGDGIYDEEWYRHAEVLAYTGVGTRLTSSRETAMVDASDGRSLERAADTQATTVRKK